MSTLLYMDEKVAAPLSQKIEQIRAVEQAFKLDEFIQAARKRNGPAWKLSPGDIDPFIDRGPSERAPTAESADAPGFRDVPPDA